MFIGLLATPYYTTIDQKAGTMTISNQTTHRYIILGDSVAEIGDDHGGGSGNASLLPGTTRWVGGRRGRRLVAATTQSVQGVIGAVLRHSRRGGATGVAPLQGE